MCRSFSLGDVSLFLSWSISAPKNCQVSVRNIISKNVHRSKTVAHHDLKIAGYILLACIKHVLKYEESNRPMPETKKIKTFDQIKKGQKTLKNI